MKALKALHLVGCGPRWSHGCPWPASCRSPDDDDDDDGDDDDGGDDDGDDDNDG